MIETGDAVVEVEAELLDRLAQPVDVNGPGRALRPKHRHPPDSKNPDRGRGESEEFAAGYVCHVSPLMITGLPSGRISRTVPSRIWARMKRQLPCSMGSRRSTGPSISQTNFVPGQRGMSGMSFAISATEKVGRITPPSRSVSRRWRRREGPHRL